MQNNPLLAKLKLPGKIIQLPSGGRLYTNGELAPNVKNGEIEVRPLSAYAEITIKSPELLFTGKALEEVILECAPDVLKPLDLFSQDIDMLLTAIRSVTYGSSFEVSVKHNCAKAKKQNINVNIDSIIARSRTLDPTEMDQLYRVELPNGQVVNLHPLRFKDIINLMQNIKKIEEQKTLDPEFQKKILTDNFLMYIRDVDGIDDRDMISEWLRGLPAPSAQMITDRLDSPLEWGVNLVHETKCMECGETFQFEIPINPVSFFSK